MALSCESSITPKSGHQVVNKAVFLDRDGVLNHPIIKNGKSYPPQFLKDFVIYEDAYEATKRLKQHGFLLVVVTNQPDVGRGTQNLETVEKMHSLLISKLPIDRVEMETDEDSENYKPKPGMITRSSKLLGIDISKSYMIGDRWRDVGAGQNAACRKTILIDRGNAEPLNYIPNYACSTLLDAVEYILQDQKEIT